MLLLRIKRWEKAAVGRHTERFAEEYRKLIGVMPGDQEKLRIELEGIVNGSRRKVSDILHSINSDTFTQKANPPTEHSDADVNDWL